MLRQLRLALLVAVGMIAAAAPSHAEFVDFFVAGSSPGSVTIGTTVSGTNLSVFQVQGQDTQANPGIFSQITNGRLSFNTGSVTGTDLLGNTFFGPGGFVTITGTFQGITGDLLTAEFNSFTQLQNLGGNTFRLLGGGLTNIMLADSLLEFFNTAEADAGGFSLLLGGAGASPSVNSGNISVSVAGTFQGAAIPEPASCALLAMGLGGLAVARRRRLQAA